MTEPDYVLEGEKNWKPTTTTSRLEFCVCGHMKWEHVHLGQAAAGCSHHGCECYVYASTPEEPPK